MAARSLETQMSLAVRELYWNWSPNLSLFIWSTRQLAWKMVIYCDPGCVIIQACNWHLKHKSSAVNELCSCIWELPNVRSVFAAHGVTVANLGSALRSQLQCWILGTVSQQSLRRTSSLPDSSNNHSLGQWNGGRREKFQGQEKLDEIQGLLFARISLLNRLPIIKVLKKGLPKIQELI